MEAWMEEEQDQQQVVYVAGGSGFLSEINESSAAGTGFAAGEAADFSTIEKSHA